MRTFEGQRFIFNFSEPYSMVITSLFIVSKLACVILLYLSKAMFLRYTKNCCFHLQAYLEVSLQP